MVPKLKRKKAAICHTAKKINRFGNPLRYNISLTLSIYKLSPQAPRTCCATIDTN
jgi:hypothetical protein